jgi:hypothetical protein
MKKKLILYCVFCFTIFSLSCKKEISSDNKFTSVNESSSPSIRITSASPKGILYFSSKKEFENFMGKLKNMPSEEWASLLPQNFNSLSKYFKEYKEKSKKT